MIEYLPYVCTGMCCFNMMFSQWLEYRRVRVEERRLAFEMQQ
jgi:hypothetical protein